MWMLLLALNSADAAEQAVTLSGAWSGAEPRVELGTFRRLDSGVQLGAMVQVGQARGVYLDGWPVTGGRTRAVLGSVTVPLIQRGVQMDLRLDLGPQFLAATETTGPHSSAFGVRGVLSPMATVPLGERAALRLGWSFKYAMELDPVRDTEAQAFIIRGGVNLALSQSVQLAALVESGSVFGFDGDGAKYLNRGTLGVRWTPASATPWFNL